MNRTVAIAALTAILAGCNPVKPDQTTGTMNFTQADALMVTGAAGTKYYVVDQLAPNWQILQIKLDDTHYRIEMLKNRIATGGDGEPVDVFHRHAEDIAAQAHAWSYTLVSWNEGVESEFPFARRWAHGVLEIAPAKVGQQ